MKTKVEPHIDQQPIRSDNQSGSNRIITNFVEARHQLLLESRQRAVSDGMTRAIQKESARSQLLTASSTVAEETLYLLFSAPALVYLIYIVFHL